MNTLFKLLVISLLVFNFTYAQIPNKQEEKSFLDNVQFGGGIGLSFGNNFFSGTLTPFALYKLNDYIMTGAGLNFTYSSFNDNEILVYGGSLMTIGRLTREFQLSLEFEQLRVSRKINDIKDNYWYPALFLGVGYNSGHVTFGIRYDVLYNENKSIYANAFMPFVRVFF